MSTAALSEPLPSLSSPRPAGRVRVRIERAGGAAIDALTAVGDVAYFFGGILRRMFARPARGTLLACGYQIGALSLPVVALTGTFIGMVLAVQSYTQFATLGLESRLGAVINGSLVRELGPVLAATMLAGRVGGSMAAVLGTMRVTEQIEALEVMGADPIRYLVVPRFLACLLLIPALTLMADFMGIAGGYLYSTVVLRIDHAAYLTHAAGGVTGLDLAGGMIKSVCFGGIIAIVACHRGLSCRPGAEGVGRAATTAFVHSFVLILMTDLLISIAMDHAWRMFYPDGAGTVL